MQLAGFRLAASYATSSNHAECAGYGMRESELSSTLDATIWHSFTPHHKSLTIYLGVNAAASWGLVNYTNNNA